MKIYENQLNKQLFKVEFEKNALQIELGSTYTTISDKFDPNQKWNLVNYEGLGRVLKSRFPENALIEILQNLLLRVLKKDKLPFYVNIALKILVSILYKK